jgi:hypothetical protein
LDFLLTRSKLAAMTTSWEGEEGQAGEGEEEQEEHAQRSGEEPRRYETSWETRGEADADAAGSEEERSEEERVYEAARALVAAMAARLGSERVSGERGQGTARSGGESGTVELRVPVVREAVDVLNALAESKGWTRGQTVQNALTLAHYINEEVRQGGRLELQAADGRVYQLIFGWLEPSATPQPPRSRTQARRFRG